MLQQASELNLATVKNNYGIITYLSHAHALAHKGGEYGANAITNHHSGRIYF